MTTEWMGIYNADIDDHRRMWERYGDTDIPRYRWQIVEDDGNAYPRIHSDKRAADGIWTLAEYFAGGADEHQAARLAQLMILAIREHELGELRDHDEPAEENARDPRNCRETPHETDPDPTRRPRPDRPD